MRLNNEGAAICVGFHLPLTLVSIPDIICPVISRGPSRPLHAQCLFLGLVANEEAKEIELGKKGNRMLVSLPLPPRLEAFADSESGKGVSHAEFGFGDAVVTALLRRRKSALAYFGYIQI